MTEEPKMITMTEEEFYAQISVARNTNFYLGISNGLEQAGKFLLDESGREFIAGNDKMAGCFRSLARKLYIRSENQRKGYDELRQVYRKENPTWEWL